MIASFFAGIGGLELGLEQAGLGPTVFQCEFNPYAQKILEKHWPGVPRHDDITTLRPADIPHADVWCGGFPCQDISVAGKGAGLDGDRSGLWYAWLDLIRVVRPRVLVVENVAALASRGLGVVLGQLSEAGYDAEWETFGAADVGAPHRRLRVFIIAFHRDSDGGPEGEVSEVREGAHPEPGRDGDVPDAEGAGQRPGVPGRGEQLAGPDSRRDAGEPCAAVPDTLGDAVRVESERGAASRGGDPIGVDREGEAWRGSSIAGDDGTQGHVADAKRLRELQPQGGEPDERGRSGDSGPEVADADDQGSQGHRGLCKCPSERATGEGRGAIEGAGIPQSGVRGMAHGPSPWMDGEWPGVPRVASGVPNRVDRLRCLGNAVVPQCARLVGLRVQELLKSPNP